MIVFVFAALYVACSVLLVAVVWQDRNRDATRRPPDATDARRSHAPTLVFRTHT